MITGLAKDQHPGKKVGRKLEPDHLYAVEVGSTKRRIQSLGGADRLRAMSDDARKLLLGPHVYGKSRTLKMAKPFRWPVL